MPWMPEFFSAPIAEAQQAEEVARINDAVAYYEGILAEKPDALIRSFVEQPPPEPPEPLRLKLFAQLEEGGLGRPSPPSSQGLSPALTRAAVYHRNTRRLEIPRTTPVPDPGANVASVTGHVGPAPGRAGRRPALPGWHLTGGPTA